MEIRKINKSDILKLQKIGIKTFSETFSEMNSEHNLKTYLATKFSVDNLAIELACANSEFYFVEQNKEAIGYLKVNFGGSQTENKNENALEIERIYVIKDFHGKKVGNMLYRKALEIATAKKVNFIWLGVWENNFRAIKFYEKNGFVVFDKHFFKLGNGLQTDLMMKLNLFVNT